ncbi:hypothetical protein ACO1O0_003237 [Amphichorda felina]
MMSDPMVPSVAQMDDHLFVGNAAASQDSTTLLNNGITAIVSLMDTESEVQDRPGNRSVVPPDRHLILHCRDTSTMDLIPLLSPVCDFIDGQIAGPPPRGLDSTTGRVLIHCTQGMSRSPTVGIAYLMRRRREGLHRILAEVKRKRDIRPRGSFMEQLQVWESLGYEPWEEAQGETPKEEYQEYLDRLDAKLRRKQSVSEQESGLS